MGTVESTLSKIGYSYSRIINEFRGQAPSVIHCLKSKLFNTKGKKRQSVAAGLPPQPLDNLYEC